MKAYYFQRNMICAVAALYFTIMALFVPVTLTAFYASVLTVLAALIATGVIAKRRNNIRLSRQELLKRHKLLTYGFGAFTFLLSAAIAVAGLVFLGMDLSAAVFLGLGVSLPFEILFNKRLAPLHRRADGAVFD